MRLAYQAWTARNRPLADATAAAWIHRRNFPPGVKGGGPKCVLASLSHRMPLRVPLRLLAAGASARAEQMRHQPLEQPAAQTPVQGLARVGALTGAHRAPHTGKEVSDPGCCRRCAEAMAASIHSLQQSALRRDFM